MRWWWQKKVAPQEIPESPEEDDVDLDYEYEEPERGDFDYPHRIRPVQQMIDDDLAAPIAANAFLAYREQQGNQVRARNEFDLSIWECIPDVDEDGKRYTKGVEPEPKRERAAPKSTKK